MASSEHFYEKRFFQYTVEYQDIGMGKDREPFGPWLLRQITSNQFEGVRWLDASQTLFSVPWKHLNIKTKNEKDYGIFKAWAIESGKYNDHYKDPPTWKRNFRSAMRSVMSGDRKMFSEVKNNSQDNEKPHKIYRVNYVQAVPLQPAFRNAAPTVPNPVPPGQNLTNEAKEDYSSLQISPDTVKVVPFSLNRESDEDILELLESFNLGTADIGVQEPAQIYITNVYTHKQPANVTQNPVTAYAEHNDFQLIPDHFMRPVDLPAQDSCTPMSHQATEQQVYNISINGYDHVPHVEQIYRPSFESTYEITNGHVETPAVMDPASSPINGLPMAGANAKPLSSQQKTWPHITEWEVSIFYKGKLVSKANVTKNFLLNTGDVNPTSGPVDFVHFPSTEDLVDQTQAQYTKTILDNLNGGLLLEVDTTDYKLYATRLSKSRVFWSMSGGLEASNSEVEAKLISRDARTEIFDFQQYWKELMQYKDCYGKSPDYTIYMCFGQNLDNQIMRKLVLVKLVPQFCVFTHEMLQKQGVSSLNQDLISLQISNGSCDQDYPCSMDIDFSYLV
ncbi:interferon regulatory factor 7 [Pelodytes ibericus]